MRTTARISRLFLGQFCTGALALLSFVGCSGADGGPSAGDEAVISVGQQDLRGQRQHISRQPPSVSRVVPASNPDPTGTPATTGNVASSGFSIDPLTGAFVVHVTNPNIDPNSGVNYDDLSNVAVDSGGRCVNNGAMFGSCASYGVQCVYDAANETHYCTCVFNNSMGIQGWECR